MFRSLIRLINIFLRAQYACKRRGHAWVELADMLTNTVHFCGRCNLTSVVSKGTGYVSTNDKFALKLLSMQVEFEKEDADRRREIRALDEEIANDYLSIIAQRN